MNTLLLSCIVCQVIVQVGYELYELVYLLCSQEILYHDIVYFLLFPGNMCKPRHQEIIERKRCKSRRQYIYHFDLFFCLTSSFDGASEARWC